jgi:nudix-type nucleoside diphosphatase (YffH/AdpP family)
MAKRTAILGTWTIYEGWMKIIRIKVQIDAEQIEREVEDHGRAVAVLPYDPERHVILLAQQLRVPVLLADCKTELLEAAAGMVDAEQPDETAVREASEELGVNLKLLEHVAGAWTSPGVSTEFMDLYLAPYSVADRVSAGGGLASEHEAISVLEMPIPELWRLVELQQLKDLKTLALVLLLRAYHPHLFRVPV